MRISGEVMSVDMIPTFCLFPAERLRISIFLPNTSPPVKCSNFWAMSSILQSFIPDTRLMNVKYSSGVRKSMRKPLSMNALVKCFHSSLSFTFTPFSSTLPSSAFKRSRIRRKRVVLPAPLLPTRPIISPLFIVSSGMLHAKVSPNNFFKFFIVIIIAKA